MKKIIATTNAPAAIGPYSQAIDCGSFLVTSGQVPQTEKVEKPPTPSETANVTTPRPTLPEPEELILPAITEKQESGMPETESAPEVAAKELPIPAPEIEKQFEAEQKTAPESPL